MEKILTLRKAEKEGTFNLQMDSENVNTYEDVLTMLMESLVSVAIQYDVPNTSLISALVLTSIRMRKQPDEQKQA